MRKADAEVREVLCSETGKPMAKIPAWMADINVKFVSDESKQRHPTLAGIADLEPKRVARASVDEDKDLDIEVPVLEDEETDEDLGDDETTEDGADDL